MQRRIDLKSQPLPPSQEGEGEASDTKNAVSRAACRGKRGRAATQTPCGLEIGSQKLEGRVQRHGAGLDYGHLRYNLYRNAEPFSRGTICLARLRLDYESHVPDRGVMHGGMIVTHSRHRVRILTAAVVSLRS